MRFLKRWLAHFCMLVLASGCSAPPLAGLSPAEQMEPAVERTETSAAAIEVPLTPGQEVVEFAATLLGVKYRYGGTNPDTGLDCSGFIIHVYRTSLGIELPRRVVDISKVGQPVSLSELQPGDLVFFNTRGFKYSHAGIYVGNNKFIHAPRSGKRVQLADMSLPYWSRRHNGARRLIAGSTGPLLTAFSPFPDDAAPSLPLSGAELQAPHSLQE